MHIDGPPMFGDLAHERDRIKQKLALLQTSFLVAVFVGRLKHIQTHLPHEVQSIVVSDSNCFFVAPHEGAVMEQPANVVVHWQVLRHLLEDVLDVLELTLCVDSPEPHDRPCHDHVRPIFQS